MDRHWHRWVISFIVLGLVGCASRQLDTELTRCVYPDSPRTPAPSFVCGDSVTGYPLSVLRSSEAGENSVSDRIQTVLDDQIQQWTTDFSADWFADDAELQRARTFLRAWLTDNARIVRSRVSPNATLWLLVAIPSDLPSLETMTRQAVSGDSLD